MNKTLIIAILVFLLITTFIIVHYTFINKDHVASIIRLEEENKNIQKRNNILLGEIDSISKEIVMYDTIFNIIVTNDSVFRHQIDSLQNKITQIKTLYEKSVGVPYYINSDTIKRYFSNF